MSERFRRYVFRAVVGLLALASLYYLFLAGEYSAFDVRALERERARAALRLDSLRAGTDSLLRRADSLIADPTAIETVAREQHGLIRDGERVYRFVEPKEETIAAPREAGTVDAPAPSR
ncbi:MAG: septum formation initiator family protein [Gemmatimonadota bacterium]